MQRAQMNLISIDSSVLFLLFLYSFYYSGDVSALIVAASADRCRFLLNLSAPFMLRRQTNAGFSSICLPVFRCNGRQMQVFTQFVCPLQCCGGRQMQAFPLFVCRFNAVSADAQLILLFLSASLRCLGRQMQAFPLFVCRFNASLADRCKLMSFLSARADLNYSWLSIYLM